MPAAVKWSDLSMRAVSVAFVVPALVLVIIYAPAWVFSAMLGVALVIAGRECVTLARRAGGARGTRVLPALFAVIYCGLLPAHLGLLRHDAGTSWVLLALAVAWGGDIAGYVAGNALGGPRLAPGISPAKTMAGALAGLAASALAGYLCATRLGIGDAHRIIVIAVSAGVLSQAGDLAESLLKRRAGVKDSGAIISGHGGMLDCIDGLILAAPWLFYAHRYLV